jgi:hypothetical protein
MSLFLFIVLLFEFCLSFVWVLFEFCLLFEFYGMFIFCVHCIYYSENGEDGQDGEKRIIQPLIGG